MDNESGDDEHNPIIGHMLQSYKAIVMENESQRYALQHFHRSGYVVLLHSEVAQP
jgi:hypothetical protein